ncbi:hypothetical protein DP117_35455 [Brasilonema sp. UFV-L1]|nr:hypothetical protein [Brasilonema sp. UFV-L1]
MPYKEKHEFDNLVKSLESLSRHSYSPQQHLLIIALTIGISFGSLAPLLVLRVLQHQHSQVGTQKIEFYAPK